MPRPPEQGVLFPGPPNEKGKRPTTDTAKAMFAAAVGAVDQGKADAVLNERKWRAKYAKHVVANVEASAASPEAAIKVAQAGLDYAHSTFEFVRGEETLSVDQAMRKFDGTFHTGVIEGDLYGEPFDSELVIPYAGRVFPFANPKGEELSGDALIVQVEEWVRRGVIEMSCGQAIVDVVKSPKYRDLSGRYFVLFGATSAMGPLDVLLSLGAHVIAIDLGGGGSDFSKKVGPMIWGKLIKRVRASRGAMTFPLGEKFHAGMSDEDMARTAGCNLLEDTPEIKNWLLSLDQQPAYKDKPFTLGCYAYLDADRFVRIAIAMDAICKELIAKRKKGTVSLAYLCTPTDCHLATASAAAAQRKALRQETTLQTVLRSMGYLKKNARKPVEAAAGPLHPVDCIVGNQGPNYILAKRLQHWRAMVARDVDGCVVSSNVAPSTATVSVTKNRAFAAAYKVMHKFKPMEVATPALSNSAMTAMLLYDLQCPTSAANPDTELANPLCLFTEGSFHGGAWRTAHKMGSFDVATICYFLMLTLTDIYMTLYNFAAVGGWSVCAYLLVTTMTDPSAPPLWPTMGTAVSLTQMTAMMEVVHAVLGFVRADPVTTGLQVLSRLGVVGLLDTAGEAVPNEVLATMLTAWCITEIVRYSFFGLKCLGVQTPAIMNVMTFLRYTLFIVLYPMGTMGELVSVWYCRDTMTQQLAAVDLSTAWVPLQIGYTHAGRAVESAGMDMPTFWVYVVYPIYALGFPFLYTHMLKQRKKVMGKKAKAKRGKTKTA